MRRDREYTRSQLAVGPLLSIAAMVLVIVGAATRGDTVFLAIAIAILLLGIGRLVHLMRRAA